MRRHLFVLLFIGLLGSPILLANNTIAKSYLKEYYNTGQLKAEGWSMQNQKTDFWIFYHPNGQVREKGHFYNNKRQGYWYYYNSKGQLLKEGHFIENSAQDWWIFYEIDSAYKSKFEYKNNQKNGFGLQYRKNKLIKALKYYNDKKIGEWESLREFRRDNPEVSF
jgi:antitoxin component YwqK of YwqJK toxin-antitoxin module